MKTYRLRVRTNEQTYRETYRGDHGHLGDKGQRKKHTGKKWREEQGDVLHGLDYCGEWGAMWEGASHLETALVRTSISMMRCFKTHYPVVHSTESE